MTYAICRWFTRCTNTAVGTVEHPVLGDVPTCQRCADMLGLTIDAERLDDDR